MTFVQFASNHAINNKYTIARFPLKIVILISEIYNFQIFLKRSSEYGLPIKNTTRWSGLLGMLHRNEADIGGQSLFYSKARVPVVDSGLSIFKFRQSFIFRHPKYATNQRNVFLMPLQMNVWMGIFVVAFFVVVALYLIHIKDSRDTIEEHPFVIALVNVVGLLAQQGVISDHLTCLKAKIVIFLTLVLSFICFQFYSASIVSSLLTPPVRSITSLPRLTESHIKVILEDHPSSRLVFKTSPDLDLVDVFEKKVKGHDNLVSIEKGISMIKSGPYAFLTTVDEIADMIKANLSRYEIDQLQEISVITQDHRSLIYIPLPKQGAFNELIRVGALKITEVGLKEYHMKNYITNVTNEHSTAFQAAEVDFERTSSIFYFLMFGYLASVAVLLSEIGVIKILSGIRKIQN